MPLAKAADCCTKKQRDEIWEKALIQDPGWGRLPPKRTTRAQIGLVHI